MSHAGPTGPTAEGASRPDQAPPSSPRLIRRRVLGGMLAFWAVLAVGLLVIALAGCGGTEPAAPDPAPAPSGADAGTGGDTVVVALGDSITAGSPLWDPDESIRARLGAAADERSQFEYWAAKRDPSLEFRNCGVFGERTDQIAERLESCADGADALIVQGGINDIAQGRPVADAAADLRSMVVAGRELGLAVTLVDVLPWNNGHPAADEPIADLNREIERIGRDEGVPVLPFHDTLEDRAVPGTMEAGLTDDGDHPSVAGYRLLGAEVATGADLP